MTPSEPSLNNNNVISLSSRIAACNRNSSQHATVGFEKASPNDPFFDPKILAEAIDHIDVKIDSVMLSIAPGVMEKIAPLMDVTLGPDDRDRLGPMFAGLLEHLDMRLRDVQAEFDHQEAIPHAAPDILSALGHQEDSQTVDNRALGESLWRDLCDKLPELLMVVND